MRLAWACICAALCGCAALPDDGTLMCFADPARACPSGYACIDGRCYRNGHAPDLGVGNDLESDLSLGGDLPSCSIARDDFQRADQPKWGVASDGNAWGADANTLATFSINGQDGVYSSVTAAAAVLGRSVVDGEVLLAGSIDGFANNDDFGAMLRWSPGDNFYKFRVSPTDIIILKHVAGVATHLMTQSPPIAIVVGARYWLRFRMIGDTAWGKVWADGSPEPSAWSITVTDPQPSFPGGGQCGAHFFINNATADMGATTTIRLSSFQAYCP